MKDKKNEKFLLIKIKIEYSDIAFTFLVEIGVVGIQTLTKNYNSHKYLNCWDYFAALWKKFYQVKRLFFLGHNHFFLFSVCNKSVCLLLFGDAVSIMFLLFAVIATHLMFINLFIDRTCGKCWVLETFF